MSLHLEQIYISLPDPRCWRAAGVHQTPAPAPTCPGRGLLRQQHALFNRYLTHLALPPAARHCRRARPRVQLLLGWDFAAAGFMGRPQPPALAHSPRTAGLQKLSSRADSGFPSLQIALCKGQGKQVKKSFMKKTTPRHHSRHEILGWGGFGGT